MFNPQIKLLCHGNKVEEWLKCERVMPVLVEIATTGYCNAHCPWCFFEDKKTFEEINTEVLLKTIQDLSSIGLKAINWTGGGEPTLHPDFAEFVSLAYELGIKQGLFSNSYNEIPEQEKFDWIRISLTDKKFDAIVKPRVPFGICVNQVKEQDAEEIKDMCLTAKNFGASYFQIRPALVGSYKNQIYLEIPKYLKRFEDDTFKVYLTSYKYEDAVLEKEYDECYGYHFCPSIDWKGNLGTCLYMMSDPRFVFGDLNKEDFLSIWLKIPEKIKGLSECQNACKNHEVNKYLYAAKNIKHIDFI